MALAFHEPKKLNEESRKLMTSAGLVVVATVADHDALIKELRTIDAAGAWK